MKRLNNTELFNTAQLACKELKQYISGDLQLTYEELESRRSFIKDASKESLYFFSKCVLGFELLTSQTHKVWSDKLQKDFWKFDRLMRLKPRGTFKTTLYAEAFIMWVWATISPQIRFFYTSANQTLLDEVSAHMDHYIGLQSESLYSLVFGIKRDKKARKNTQEICNILGRDVKAKGSSLMFRTAGGATNGVHPHVIVIDDPCDKDDRESLAVRKKKEHWYDSLIPLLVPFKYKNTIIKKIMFIGTRWHLQDLINYVMGKWTKAKLKRLRYDIEIEGVLNEQNELRYPELINYEDIDELKSEMSEVFFSCQYLNDPLPEGLQLFPKERLHFIREDQYDIREGTNYCFFDPSQGKEGSDFPAVFWVNFLNGRRIFFDAIDDKIMLASIIPLICKKNVETNTRVFVYETNGTTLLEETFYAEHKKLGYTLFIEGIHETRNKAERIAATQPELFNGANYFRADYEMAYKEAMNQIFFYPAWGFDDFPDIVEKALSYLNKFAVGSFGGSSDPSSKNTLTSGLNKSTNY